MLLSKRKDANEGAPDLNAVAVMRGTLRAFAQLSRRVCDEDDHGAMRLLVSDLLAATQHYCENQHMDFEGLLLDSHGAFLDQCEEFAEVAA